MDSPRVLDTRTRPQSVTDDIFAELCVLYEGEGDEAALPLTARLALILANHIGEARIIAEAVRLAKENVED